VEATFIFLWTGSPGGEIAIQALEKKFQGEGGEHIPEVGLWGRLAGDCCAYRRTRRNQRGEMKGAVLFGE